MPQEGTNMDTGMLILKIDAIVSGIKDNNDISRQVLGEVKRMGDVMGLEIEHLKEMDSRIWKELEEEKDSRRAIKERLEDLERLCAARHGLCVSHSAAPTLKPFPAFDAEATKFLHTTVGKFVIWGAMLALGAIISEVIDKLL